MCYWRLLGLGSRLGCLFWFVLGDFGVPFWGLSPAKGVQGVPKWSQNGDKVSPKIHAEKCVVWDRLLECVWWALGTFLEPWTFKNECLV